MEGARTIILPPGTVIESESGVQQIFELFVAAADTGWATLELRSRSSDHTRTVTCGSPSNASVTVELDVAEGVDAVVTLGGTVEPQAALLESLRSGLRHELQRLRLLAENALLRGGLEATSAAVLLFGPTGNIVYANGPGDRLLSKQTEDELTVDWNDHGPQPLFRLLCGRVTAALDGASQGAWRSRFDLADGTELAAEVVPLQTGGDRFGRLVLVVVREVGLPPKRRIEEFSTLHGLSPREHEVLQLLVEGCDTASMADRLGISPHTIRDHLKHVLRKTSTRSRNELLSAIASASTITG